MSATSADTVPVHSFEDAAPLLRRPFTAAAVKFKVQATWDGGALIVGYIDARLAIERLNHVIPHLWHDAYRPVGSGLMWCDLTVADITRSDVGEGTGKGLVSDALKRAAVKFGVGVSLYAIPKMIVTSRASHLKKGRKDAYELTPSGEARVRTLYAGWLDIHGKKAFGEPLDHGDVEDAQGDTEVDAPAASPPPAPMSLSPAVVDAIVKLITDAKLGADGAEWLREQLMDIGVESVPEGKPTKATLAVLTEEQADKLMIVLGEVIDGQKVAA